MVDDIGRTLCAVGARHAVEGYNIMKDRDAVVARICATHSFPTNKATDYQGTNNCTDEDLILLQNEIEKRDLLDDIIRLADCYSESEGFVSPFQRFVNIDKRITFSSKNAHIRNAYILLHHRCGLDISNYDTHKELTTEFADCMEVYCQLPITLV